MVDVGGSPAEAQDAERRQAARGLGQLLEAIVGSRDGPKLSSRQAAELRSSIDAALSAHLERIYSDPGFEQVESAWLGLRALVRSIDFRSGTRLHVLPAKRSALLQSLVLAPLLGIEDPRTDARIAFVGGIRGTDELEERAGSDGVAAL